MQSVVAVRRGVQQRVGHADHVAGRVVRGRRGVAISVLDAHRAVQEVVVRVRNLAERVDGRHDVAVVVVDERADLLDAAAVAGNLLGEPAERVVRVAGDRPG